MKIEKIYINVFDMEDNQEAEIVKWPHVEYIGWKVKRLGMDLVHVNQSGIYRKGDDWPDVFQNNYFKDNDKFQVKLL